MARALGHRLLLAFSTTMAVLITSVGTARAGESARLAYVRGEGAGQCADEKGLRLAVAVRLGYDPFVAWAPKTVHANVSRDAGRLRARVYLAAEDGRAQGSRELFAGINECDKLLAAVALAISIAVDPMSLGATPADAKPAPPAGDASDSRDAGTKDRRGAATAVASTAATPVSGAQALVPPEPHDVASPEPPRAATPGSALQWFGGLGFAVATGASPDISFGLDIYARLGIDRVSIAVEGRYQLPASAESASGSGSVEARLYLASIEPCYQLAPLFFCGLATVGLLQAKGEGVTNPLEEQSLYWAAGGRAAIEAQVWAPFSVRGHLDVVGNGTRLALALDGLEVWRAPAVALAAGATALARF